MSPDDSPVPSSDEKIPEELLAELYKSIWETWRFQVTSNWQRSSYFAAFETVALAGVWKVLAESRPIGLIFCTLGAALTLFWWLNDRRTYRYARHWWESLQAVEAKRQLPPGLNLVSQLEKKKKGMLQYRYIVQAIPILFLIAWLALPISAIVQLGSPLTYHEENAKSPRYFDAHNHSISAILPYYAYADLKAFIQHPTDPIAIDLNHRQKLWKYIVKSQPSQNLKLTGPNNRIAPGAIATINAYRNAEDLTPQQINGALERVLTATPWTEFDSAYAFRGSPVEGYLGSYFGSDTAAMATALCDASIIQLAITNIQSSEQFVNFIGGWNDRTLAGHPVSPRLDTIRCFMNEPAKLVERGMLQGKPAPEIKVLLMTHTSELGATPDGKNWMQYGETGNCQPISEHQTKPSELPSKDFKKTKLLETTPDTLKFALMGKKPDGTEMVGPEERTAFFNEVVGIDTAAPEITCFTPSGMERYKALVQGIYDAARQRRAVGWHGKLLVHTHVAEGSPTYQIDHVPKGGPKEIFKSFPEVWLDKKTQQPVHVSQAAQNIKLLIQAVDDLHSKIADIDDYVIFRFGHVTHADMADATAMKRLHIEADINLESNIATGAYYIPQAPNSKPPCFDEGNFDCNNFPGKVLNSGHAAEILANHALKYMLQAKVRTLLGTDGGGVEHSDIVREYELAQDLIHYWISADPAFPHDISIDMFFKNVEDHEKDMKADTRLQQ